MKILATTDIHQMISKWKELVKICKADKFDVVALTGDLLPKDEYIVAQMPFIKHLRRYAKQINDTGAKIVIVLGNDDNQNMIPEMEKAHEEGLWYYIPENVVTIKGYEFAAMPYVPDYPFGYKFWCRAEYKDNLRISTLQLCDPLIVNKDNEWEIIKNYPEFLSSQKSIWDSLVDTASKVKDIHKSIWLIHAPPANLFLDVCAHGDKVGSLAVHEFITKYQPLLTIHGHIHESPEYNGHKWCQHEGNTLCVQGGQIGFKLHYSIIAIEDGKIVRKEHSVYNEYTTNF